MSPRTNELDQPIGEPITGWETRPRPPRTPMEGRLCRVEPLRADAHAAPLYEAHRLDAEGRNWTYLPYGPFSSVEEYRLWVESKFPPRHRCRDKCRVVREEHRQSIDPRRVVVTGSRRKPHER